MTNVTALRPLTGSIARYDTLGPLDQAVAGFLIRLSNPHTFREYQRDLSFYFAWCAEQDLKPLQVERFHIEGYLRYLQMLTSPRTGRPLMEATVSRRFGTVRCFYQYAADEEFIGKDPTRRVPRPDVDPAKQKRTYLNVVEWAQLLRAARDHSPTAHCLVALLGMKGLRIHEACQLDIDLHFFTKDGYDHIRFVGKGSKAAVITLPPPVARAVREITDERDHGPLLLNQRGRRMDRGAANRLLQVVAEQGMVVAEFSPHSLRRTMITTALGQGVPLYEVQLLARHADSKTTSLYDMNRANVDRLSGAAVASFMSSIAG